MFCQGHISDSWQMAIKYTISNLTRKTCLYVHALLLAPHRTKHGTWPTGMGGGNREPRTKNPQLRRLRRSDRFHRGRSARVLHIPLFDSFRSFGTAGNLDWLKGIYRAMYFNTTSCAMRLFLIALTVGTCGTSRHLYYTVCFCLALRNGLIIL